MGPPIEAPGQAMISTYISSVAQWGTIEVRSDEKYMDNAENTQSKRDVTYTHFNYSIVCLLLSNKQYIHGNIPPQPAHQQTRAIALLRNICASCTEYSVCVRIPSNQYMFHVLFIITYKL